MSASELTQGTRKQRSGIVVSDRMNKTRSIEIVTLRRDSLYQKVLRQSKCLLAHDESNASKMGDRVLIEETRPLSKLKRWRVVRVFEKGK
ncbi:MAG: 30S ribosomal protein S17 [Elusimicrobiota bacterium]